MIKINLAPGAEERKAKKTKERVTMEMGELYLFAIALFVAGLFLGIAVGVTLQ